jgi:hypothetical protein
MKTIEIEVYYGYYLGDAQMWDTAYIFIPADTPEEKYEEVGKKVFLSHDHGEDTIAFVGLYSVDQDQFCDDEDSPD